MSEMETRCCIREKISVDSKIYIVQLEGSGLHHILTHGEATIFNVNIDQACHILPDKIVT
jgi:hypothetical protein